MGLENKKSAHQQESGLSAWLAEFVHLPLHQKPPLLDLRSAAAFDSDHIANASNFPFCLENGIQSWLNELPAAFDQPQIAIVSTNDQFTIVSEQLSRKRYPYPIHLANINAQHLPRARCPSRALWSPALIVLHELPRILNQSQRTVLDVGCGSGRDSAFLALAGFSVTAVDRDVNLLVKADRIWRKKQYHPLLSSRQSGGTVQTVSHTFGANRSEDFDFLRQNASGILLIVRFLRRSALHILCEGVRPGGLVLYEHFLIGCERFGSPTKPSQMLNRGELRAAFSEKKGFQVLRDEECTLTDGRPIVRFVAQKNP